jgi:HD-like signal output (HDOD) protein
MTPRPLGCRTPDLSTQGAERVVDEVATMLSFPAVALRICEVAEDPDATTAELQYVVAQDPALTARLLQLANSPVFGMPREITTISRAITVLGLRTVRDLAFGVAAVHSFDRIPAELVTMEDFWTRSMLSALAARELAGRSPRRSAAETAFVAGLLHDIGLLVLFQSRPDASREALLMLADDPGELTLQRCEHAVLGFDHGAVGGALARRWRLPPTLQECIEFADDPARAVRHPLEVAIVHIADRLATLAEADSVDLDDAPPVAADAWGVSGLSAACTAEVVAAARAQLAGVRAMLR